MRFMLSTLMLAAFLAISGYLVAGPFADQARSAGAGTFADSIATALHARTSRILSEDCARCHGGARPAAQLNLEGARFVESLVGVSSRQIDTLKLVDVKRPEMSYLLTKLWGTKGMRGERMPLGEKPLSDEEMGTIELWTYAVAALKGAAAPVQPAEPGKKKALKENGRGESSGRGTRAFFGNTLLNLPTAELPGRGEWLFRVSHRFFYPTNAGHEHFLGLDGPAYILLSLGVGITDRLSASLGRTNLNDEIELSSRIAIVREARDFSLPFSATLIGSVTLTTERPAGAGLFDGDAFQYNMQLALSRRFTDRISILCVPGYSSNTRGRPYWSEYEHWNKESTTALGIGGRFVLIPNVSLIGEWTPVLSGHETKAETWGVGLEAKKGGHVFHVFVTDAYGLTANQYIAGGDLNDNGDYRFGFNIYRTL